MHAMIFQSCFIFLITINVGTSFFNLLLVLYDGICSNKLYCIYETKMIVWCCEYDHEKVSEIFLASSFGN